jgi:NAD-dependent dihydropyrimidine dehydrogenase PreA subunit
MHEEKLKKKDKGQKCYAFPNKATPSMPVVFDETKCNGCNRCVTICTMDILLPNPEKGKPPIIMYPEECWYGGDCVEECPRTGAIRLRHPLMSRVHYKNKETGEIKRT